MTAQQLRNAKHNNSRANSLESSDYNNMHSYITAKPESQSYALRLFTEIIAECQRYYASLVNS